MKKLVVTIICHIPLLLLAQISGLKNGPISPDSTTYKTRVLDRTEIDLLSSFYTQNGSNAAVTGGIGTEKLNDFATSIDVAIPLNDDDILIIDGTISAYSSASSSNLNPFSGASVSFGDSDRENRFPTRRNEDDNDDERNEHTDKNIGSPWVASSGASKSDVWSSGSISYKHYTDNRNQIFNAGLNIANEFDYSSFGAKLGYTLQFNQKNTEIGIQSSVYLDHWRPQYPTEIKTFLNTNGNLNADFFNGVDILDANGLTIDKSGVNSWSPLQRTLIDTDKRNTYSVSLSFSQILNKCGQLSIFSDLVLQQGWLANPMQRVYFADRANYYIGNAAYIANYVNPGNRSVFQLADDIERLPQKRLKIPVGMRFNYYLNEFLVLRTYYRYYWDNWGIESQTAQIELPIKLGNRFTIYPNYRYYVQTAAKYFAAYESHHSSEQYYTSDFDLSAFNANQFGFGIQYTDIFTNAQIGNFDIKNLNLNYSYYHRDNGLTAHIISVGMHLVMDKSKP